MAIANTEISRVSLGNRVMIIGKSVVSGGSSGGDIVVALKNIDILMPVTAGGTQKGISVNETFPLAATDVTLVNESANATTYWFAIGV